MRIGLIDVDGHHFPNLALMRISSYHKACGDTVEWWQGDLTHYDIVYKSKVFSDTYSPDDPDPLNAGIVRGGGTGYAITTEAGREHYDRSKDPELPPEIERCRPDYSIYPQYNHAIAMTSRGCPRGCPWCHVGAKEGRRCRKVADVADFWDGQELIEVMDPNICACPEKGELFRQYRKTGARINFNQGLDVRLLTDDDIREINGMKLKRLHFAWDNPKEDLTKHFRRFKEKFRRNTNLGTVYVLTGFDSTVGEDLWRINTLAELGYDPYVMIYDKPNASEEIKHMQRWCNHKAIFKSVKFEEYRTGVKK